MQPLIHSCCASAPRAHTCATTTTTITTTTGLTGPGLGSRADCAPHRPAPQGMGRALTEIDPDEPVIPDIPDEPDEYEDPSDEDEDEAPAAQPRGAKKAGKEEL